MEDFFHVQLLKGFARLWIPPMNIQVFPEVELYDDTGEYLFKIPRDFRHKFFEILGIMSPTSAQELDVPASPPNTSYSEFSKTEQGAHMYTLGGRIYFAFESLASIKLTPSDLEEKAVVIITLENAKVLMKAFLLLTNMLVG